MLEPVDIGSSVDPVFLWWYQQGYQHNFLFCFWHGCINSIWMTTSKILPLFKRYPSVELAIDLTLYIMMEMLVRVLLTSMTIDKNDWPVSWRSHFFADWVLKRWLRFLRTGIHWKMAVFYYPASSTQASPDKFGGVSSYPLACLARESLSMQSRLIYNKQKHVLVNACVFVDMKFIRGLPRIKFDINKNKGVN